jgi:dihydrofolate reductase
MGKLVYLMNVSLDGYVETPARSLDWSIVDAEIHGWFNDRTRDADALLYGRRLWEVMAAYWPTAESDPAATPYTLDFAASWNARPKIVFSHTLESVEHGARLMAGDVGVALSTLRREFDGELSIGGPTLAAQFIERGLVDAYQLVVHPAVLGGGKPFFPRLDSPLRLRRTAMRRFESGAVLLEYVPA